MCSVDRSWGGDERLEIRPVRLSGWIREPVDFLKIDVEGAAYDVINDLIETDAIRWVREAAIKYHDLESKPGRLMRMTKGEPGGSASRRRGRNGLSDSGLPLRAVEKMQPPRKPSDPDGACRTSGRQPASVRRRSTSERLAANQWRRHSWRSGSIFRHSESRRSRSAPTRPGRHGLGLRDATSLVAIDVRAAVNRGAAAARRILPTLSGAFQDAAKRPVAVRCGGGAVSPPPVERSGGPTDAGCRADRHSRRRQRQHSPRRDVLPRREAGGRSR